mmetsp:Transcript_68227/g.147119  ORF Transcript_68227/g.147119 Transcript_68227/m.147119 type:complete len:385 (-) Transcript_68227:8-1162(-)
MLADDGDSGLSLGSDMSELSARCFAARESESDDEAMDNGLTGSVPTVAASKHRVRRPLICRGRGRRVSEKTYEVERLSEEARADLTREIRIHASLDHPNVGRLLGWRRSQEHTHLIVEHLDGDNILENLRNGGAFSEARAAAIIVQLLQAVDHLHGRGVVHRDIRLENLMCERAAGDKVELIGFGLSCEWKEGMPPLSRICGTAFYMAPEVLRGSYTNSADLWSVGVVAHEMLTGEAPSLDFWSMQAHVSPRLKASSPEASSFIRALLAEDTKRMTPSEALKHSWLQKDHGPASDCARRGNGGLEHAGGNGVRERRGPAREFSSEQESVDSWQEAAGGAAAGKSWWQRVPDSTRAVSRVVGSIRDAFRRQNDNRVTPMTDVVPG